MANENEEKVNIEPEDLQDFEEPESTVDDTGTDVTDWKAEALKRDGMARRFQTKLKKFKELEDKAKADAEAKATDETQQPQDKTDFDLAEKSYLLGLGAKKSELPFIFEEVKNTGKSIDELWDSPYFQEKLAEKRTESAIPKDTGRGGNSTKDNVDYWLNKPTGELPEDRELARKVVNARLAKEQQASKFTDHPILGR